MSICAHWIRLASLTGLVGFLLASAPPAFGQIATYKQNCLNTMNKQLEKLATTQAKNVDACLKDGSKGKLGSMTIEECTTADIKGKMNKVKGKTRSGFADRCVPPLPDFGLTDPNVVIDAAIAKEILLIHDLFGSDLDSAIYSQAGTPTIIKDRAKCQLAVSKAMHKCETAKLKEFAKCKKAALKSGASNAAALEACIGQDPRGKIAKTCTNPTKGIGKAIDKKCVGKDTGQVFLGVCAGEPLDQVDECIEKVVECRVCILINQADALAKDCDLFDDGAANGSCPPVLPTCGDGVVQVLFGEQCDDGNNDDGDGCNAVCQEEFCGDGLINNGPPGGPGEQCDDGNSQDGDCCSSSCQLESAATVCRASAGACDLEETCTGLSPDCPADQFEALGTECRPSEGICDVAEECTGTDPQCPVDAKSTEECRTSLGVCDPAEDCDGVNDDCPADAKSTEECRASAGLCDPAESCDGVSNDCPPDALEPPTTVCRADAGQCDFPENCTGTDPNCPADEFVPNGTGCDDTDPCTDPDECDTGVCVGDPDICGDSRSLPGCGEECDDGNTNDGDGCSALCLDEFCGDGLVNNGPPGGPGEECDPPGTGTCPPLEQCDIDCTCGPLDVGGHKCVFDPNNSAIQIATQALPLAPIPPGGAMDIDCGVVDPNTGKAVCDCTLQFLDPLELIGIGFICFTPGAGCPSGEIDCDGGNPLDVTMDSDHNIGACTGNPDCAAQCTAHCSGMGATLFFSGCGGFCLGGTNNGLPCTDDSQCPGGSCPGKDGLPHGNECQCDCKDVGGVASGVGALQCNLPANINVEIAAPCGDGDVLIAVGTRCIPLTTEAMTSQMHNVNNNPGKDFPIPATQLTGNRIDCLTLSSSVTTGITLVGSVNFFDSTIGDLTTSEVLSCQ
jgi:cysteine-rich repeat protein